MNDFVTVAMVLCCTTIITSLRDDVINTYRRTFAVVLSDIELGGSRTDHSPHILLRVPNSTRIRGCLKFSFKRVPFKSML